MMVGLLHSCHEDQEQHGLSTLLLPFRVLQRLRCHAICISHDSDDLCTLGVPAFLTVLPVFWSMTSSAWLSRV